MEKKYINKYNPDVVSHPGTTLSQKLEELGMSQKDFALRTGRPEKTISEIIKGKNSITKEAAIQFENVLNIPARVWLQRQYYYDEYKARLDEERALNNQVEWLKKFPLKEMYTYKLITKHKEKTETIKELLSFLRVASTEEGNNICDLAINSPYYRLSHSCDYNKYSIAVWLRHGEIIAERINKTEYNESLFKNKLKSIRSLTTSNDLNFYKSLKQDCLDAGVILVFSPQLPKAPICGVSRWYANNPLIQLSLRYKTDDNFWFTFFHEAAHTILHGKKNIFIDLDKNNLSDDKEEEADNFAADFLVPKKHFSDFLLRKDFSENAIINFAKFINISPSIVVGQLQHKKKIDYRRMNHLKKKIDFIPYDSF